MIDVNKKAALRGRSIVHSNERHRDGDDSLESVLADLLHYAARDGKDFDEALLYARQAFEEETKKGTSPTGGME